MYNYIDGDDEGINISKTPNNTVIQRHTERHTNRYWQAFNYIILYFIIYITS